MEREGHLTRLLFDVNDMKYYEDMTRASPPLARSGEYDHARSPLADGHTTGDELQS